MIGSAPEFGDNPASIRDNRDHPARVAIRAKVESASRWTKTHPHVPGQYWYRASLRNTPCIRHVVEMSGRLYVYVMGNPKTVEEYADKFPAAEWGSRPINLPLEPDPIPVPES